MTPVVSANRPKVRILTEQEYWEMHGFSDDDWDEEEDLVLLITESHESAREVSSIMPSCPLSFMPSPIMSSHPSPGEIESPMPIGMESHERTHKDLYVLATDSSEELISITPIKEPSPDPISVAPRQGN